MAKKTEADLLKAADELDYDNIKACLEAGVNPNGDKTFSSPRFVKKPTCSVEHVLLAAKRADLADKDAEKCLRLLAEKGASLGCLGNVFYSSDLIEKGAERNVRNVVKYVLTHGIKPLTDDREIRMAGILDHCHVMTEEEFDNFKTVGEIYLVAKDRGIELDVDNPLDIARVWAKWMGIKMPKTLEQSRNKTSLRSRLKTGEANGRAPAKTKKQNN